MLKIKEFRTNAGLSQAELAEIVGFNQTAIGKYERGELEPSITTLKKLADFFECSIDYLIGRSDDFGNVTVKKGDDALTAEEQAHIDVFRKLNTKNRMHVTAYAEVRLEQQESGSKFA